MTKEEFNNTIKIGDIVEIYGVDDAPVQCIVMTTTQYACNLLTTKKKKGDDGIVRPLSSYYRTYDEVIKKVGEDISSYWEYKCLDLPMKFIHNYLEEEIKLKPLGHVTLEPCASGEEVGFTIYIDGKSTTMDVWWSDYATWLEKKNTRERRII